MKTLARLTVEELREVVEEAVERKLTEMLSDPDKGRTLRSTVERRLRRSLHTSRRASAGSLQLEWPRSLGSSGERPLQGRIPSRGG